MISITTSRKERPGDEACQCVARVSHVSPLKSFPLVIADLFELFTLIGVCRRSAPVAPVQQTKNRPGEERFSGQ